MFAEKHSLVSDYYLIQGEAEPNDVYLCVGDESGSIAGPLHRIGWSKDFIIFTDVNWPVPWTVIDVKLHRIIKITEAQRANDKQFSAISFVNPDRAWKISVAR